MGPETRGASSGAIPGVLGPPTQPWIDSALARGTEGGVTPTAALTATHQPFRDIMRGTPSWGPRLLLYVGFGQWAGRRQGPSQDTWCQGRVCHPSSLPLSGVESGPVLPLSYPTGRFRTDGTDRFPTASDTHHVSPLSGWCGSRCRAVPPTTKTNSGLPHEPHRRFAPTPNPGVAVQRKHCFWRTARWVCHDGSREAVAAARVYPIPRP